MTVVYPGERGALSEAAARAMLPTGAPRGVPSVRHVFEAVASGEAARGVVPVEDSLAGSVPEAMDLLMPFAERGVRCIGELWLPVVPALVALSGTVAESIEEVVGDPRALRLAATLIDRHAPAAGRVPVADGIAAARQIAAEERAGVAAIASREAADLYGLEVIAVADGDAPALVRFFLLAPDGVVASGADKTTLALSLSQQAPNALFRALTTFVGRRLAIHRVEARPRPGRPGDHLYVVDIEGAAGQDPLAAGLADARAFCDQLVVVGSYPAAPVG